jgi:NAD(P)-dependent dehydrogenase (short-subunit alcohol dehydrogenase family)
MKLAGKVAIVTGGGTGLGLAVARRFAREGARLVLAGRRPEPLAAAVAELAAGGGKAIAAPTDATDEGQVARLVAQTLARFGQIDILVNNAGSSPPMRNVTETSLAEWNDVLAINLTAAMLCAREVVRPCCRAGRARS